MMSPRLQSTLTDRSIDFIFEPNSTYFTAPLPPALEPNLFGFRGMLTVFLKEDSPLDCSTCSSTPATDFVKLEACKSTCLGQVVDRRFLASERADLDAIQKLHIDAASSSLAPYGGSDAHLIQTRIGGYDRGHCVREASAWRAEWNSTHARYGVVIHNAGCGDVTSFIFDINAVQNVPAFLADTITEGLNTYVFTANA